MNLLLKVFELPLFQARAQSRCNPETEIKLPNDRVSPEPRSPLVAELSCHQFTGGIDSQKNK